MKKIAYLGLVALMAMSTGCSKQEEEVVDTTSVTSEQQTATAAIEATEPIETPIAMVELTEEQITPFFKALFGFSEADLSVYNANSTTDYKFYFQNLEAYRKGVEAGIGKYCSKIVLDRLHTESTKLDFDLPKKVAINNYVADASGEVRKVELLSSRIVGDHTMYKVAVTTTRKVMPLSTFESQYTWDDDMGYYAYKESGSITSDTQASYIYADSQEVADQICLTSYYWLEVSQGKGKNAFQVEGLKQASNIELTDEAKVKIENDIYIEREPYYEKVADKEKALVEKVFTKLFNIPPESYDYYNKIYTDTPELLAGFWKSLSLDDAIKVDTKDYKNAFTNCINPYHDQIVSVKLNKEKIEIVPSIYSTQLQPSFVVTLPVEAITNQNEKIYSLYKYYVSTEGGKIESISFIKMKDLEEDAYQAFLTGDVVAKEGEEASPSNSENTTETDLEIETQQQGA